MFHIFVYFWYSYQVTCQSEELCEAVYSSKWWNLPRKYRKSVLIVMQRTHKPVIFCASKFCTMTLENFVTLMKTSYSYFALLRSLHSESR
uniref:Odorant receptor 6 n=1 Tax=Subpsaltria yangi TaxID=1195109 RepID=A0A385IUS0_9HEMI|nr:odorant receptor 6 [Subpsaltria yangi]